MTSEAISSQKEYCDNWVEVLEFPSCGLTAISRFTIHGVERFYFDVKTKRLVRAVVWTDDSYKVTCANIPEPSCVDPVACHFVCYAKDGDAHLPRCKADAGVSVDARGD